ncbi:formylglycine-generating enzyme family protein, partial [Anabaena sp. UHCC 0399]|uniref:formylglycine-generating enzyme family protein n=1 Tax=Anabaena sp. UHCC 0399 TaxID=3110238 RepID=UPI002B21F5F1
EWCLDDWHDNYEGAPIDGSPWFDDHNHLYQKQGIALLRGGSWYTYPSSCRSACRYYDYRDLHVYNNGFRVVCAAGRILQ